VAPDLVKTICAAPGAGKGAHVQVWRRPDDASVTTLELLPGASSSPTVLYDDTGREQLTLPARHDSSPEALEDDRRRDTIIEDGKRAEKIPCISGSP